MFRIVAICPKEYPGVSSVLKNGKSLGYWDFLHLGEDIPANDLLLLGAWHPLYEGLLNQHKCAVYLTSTIAQMEFSINSIELDYVEQIRSSLSNKRLVGVLSGWPDTACMFPSPVSFYCPYPFDIREYENSGIKEKISNSVGIFSTYEPRKNTANELLAALNAGAEIHTNLPMRGRSIFSYGWLPDDVYRRILSRMTVSLHCHFAESFCYAAAEALLLGTLPIVSIQIAENLGLSNFLLVHQCDSFNHIMAKIKLIFGLNRNEYAGIIHNEQYNLKKQLEGNSEIIKNVLDALTKL